MMMMILILTLVGDTGADDAADHNILGAHQHLQHYPDKLTSGRYYLR